MVGEDKDRFTSRLARIPGVRLMPSIGDWILIRVERPNEVARKLNRRVSPGTVSVPRHVPGTVRVQIGDAKTNEELLRSLREVIVA